MRLHFNYKIHQVCILHFVQVGPQVAVYSQLARENGLGTSLLERLFTYYKSKRFQKAATTHAATLLTNYRCHPSILMLASSLFYECTLLSRSKSRAHPKAPFPLVFDCTSFSQEGFSKLPAENKREAEMLVRKMLELLKDWPGLNQASPPVGLLASSRQQVRNEVYVLCTRFICHVVHCEGVILPFLCSTVFHIITANRLNACVPHSIDSNMLLEQYYHAKWKYYQHLPFRVCKSDY